MDGEEAQNERKDGALVQSFSSSAQPKVSVTKGTQHNLNEQHFQSKLEASQIFASQGLSCGTYAEYLSTYVYNYIITYICT
jgi:hypothetical protein